MGEKEAVTEAAKIIGISIRTAPKSAGVDDISYKILSDSEKTALVNEIKKMAVFLIKENSEEKNQEGDRIGLA